jgi:DNA-binding NtrC family response regulator
MVKEGKFREDLYYRINVVRIELPPLRERREDVMLIAHSFLEEFSRENGKPGLRFSPEVEAIFTQYAWPGNVRELRTAVEHGVVMCRGQEILPADLPPDLRRDAAGPSRLMMDTLNLEQLEKQSIVRALSQHGGNRTLAARTLGISRRTLHRKIKEYAIED